MQSDEGSFKDVAIYRMEIAKEDLIPRKMAYLRA